MPDLETLVAKAVVEPDLTVLIRLREPVFELAWYIAYPLAPETLLHLILTVFPEAVTDLTVAFARAGVAETADEYAL